MKALRVTKGKESRVIALDHPGVLSAIVNCIDIPGRQEDYVQLELGGLDCQNNRHVRWNSIELRLGDTVVIEVIEDCDGDKPDVTEARDPALDAERRKQFIRDEAEKLGWEVKESAEARPVDSKD